MAGRAEASALEAARNQLNLLQEELEELGVNLKTFRAMTLEGLAERDAIKKEVSELLASGQIERLQNRAVNQLVNHQAIMPDRVSDNASSSASKERSSDCILSPDQSQAGSQSPEPATSSCSSLDRTSSASSEHSATPSTVSATPSTMSEKSSWSSPHGGMGSSTAPVSSSRATLTARVNTGSAGTSTGTSSTGLVNSGGSAEPSDDTSGLRSITLLPSLPERPLMADVYVGVTLEEMRDVRQKELEKARKQLQGIHEQVISSEAEAALREVEEQIQDHPAANSVDPRNLHVGREMVSAVVGIPEHVVDERLATSESNVRVVAGPLLQAVENSAQHTLEVLKRDTAETVKSSLVRASENMLQVQMDETMEMVEARLSEQAKELEQTMRSTLELEVVSCREGRQHTQRQFAQQCHAALFNVVWPDGPAMSVHELVVDATHVVDMPLGLTGSETLWRDPKLLVSLIGMRAVIKVATWNLVQKWEKAKTTGIPAPRRQTISFNVISKFPDGFYLRTLSVFGEICAEPEMASGCIVDRTHSLRAVRENAQMHTLWGTLCNAVFDFCLMLDLADYRVVTAWGDENIFEESLTGQAFFQFVDRRDCRAVLERTSKIATAGVFYDVPVTFLRAFGTSQFRLPSSCVILGCETDPSVCMLGARFSRRLSQKFKSFNPSLFKSMERKLESFKHAQKKRPEETAAKSTQQQEPPRIPGQKKGNRARSVSSIASLPSIAECDEEDSSGDSNKSMQSASPVDNNVDDTHSCNVEVQSQTSLNDSVGSLGEHSGSASQAASNDSSNASGSSSVASWKQAECGLDGNAVGSAHVSYKLAATLLEVGGSPMTKVQDMGRRWSQTLWRQFCEGEFQSSQALQEGFRTVAVILPPNQPAGQSLTYLYGQLSQRCGEVQWLDATLVDPFNVAVISFFNNTDAKTCTTIWPSASPVLGVRQEAVLRLRGSNQQTAVTQMRAVCPGVEEVSMGVNKWEQVVTKVSFVDLRACLLSAVYAAVQWPSTG